MLKSVYTKTKEHIKAMKEGAKRRWSDPQEQQRQSERFSGENNLMFGRCHEQSDWEKKSKSKKMKAFWNISSNK